MQMWQIYVLIFVCSVMFCCVHSFFKTAFGIYMQFFLEVFTTPAQSLVHHSFDHLKEKGVDKGNA